MKSLKGIMVGLYELVTLPALSENHLLFHINLSLKFSCLWLEHFLTKYLI